MGLFLFTKSKTIIMKDFFYLISILASSLTIINFTIKFLRWTLKNQKLTLKYGSLTNASLMLFASLLFLILAACYFHLKAIETHSLKTAFFVFFIFIGFAITAFLTAKYYYREYKNIKIH